MASYLRMQAAAAAPAGPESPGKEGQLAEQKHGQHTGHEQGQPGRQSNGQVKRQADWQDEGPDTSACYCNKAVACNVDVQNVQVSRYSYTLRESGLMAADSELLRGGQSQAASRCHSANVSDLLSRTRPTR